MNCTYCGSPISDARANAGFHSCMNCSEQLTVKKRGLAVMDADGNAQTFLCDGIGRSFTSLADTELHVDTEDEE